MKITFLGAARQVTGSSCLLEAAGLRVLVDCGLHQERPFLNRNWDSFPVPPDSLDVVLLTHAHLDHSGLLPKLVRDGFEGKILATAASAGLLPVALLDSARIQEEDAVYKKKRHKKEGRLGAFPEVPLYTAEDVEKTLPLVETVAYDSPQALDGGLTAVFHEAGHILGSAMIEFRVAENGGERNIIFSGDIGQRNKPLVRDPSVFRRADYVVMESTYGDRTHEDPNDVETLLAGAVKRTASAGGNLVIPTFAIERAQELMFHFGRLVRLQRIPVLPVFLDSPMAVDVTGVFEKYPDSLDEEAQSLFRGGKKPFDFPGLRLVRTVEESKSINDIRGPVVIMAGSGMCTGGRIKHHLIHNISRPDSTILFVGYQARETLGRQILERPPEVRIHGRTWPVRARVEKINGFSAHADRLGLLRWIEAFETPPRLLFVNHGDGEVAGRFADRINAEKGWRTNAPGYKEEAVLD